MNRFLPLLAVVAALLTLIAVWAVGDRIATSVRQVQGAMFPDLAAQANALTAIELEQGSNRVRLERGANDAWTIASRDHYPADFEQVRGLIVGLSQLQKDQMLTSKAARLGELNLTWPDPENRARRIRLYTSPEAEPLEVLLGQERITPRSTYVRRMPETQAWRCRGGVNGDVDVQRWMRRDLLSLPSSEFLGAGWLGLVITPKPTAGEVPKQRTADMFNARAGTDPAWTPAQISAARGVLGEWTSRVEFDDVRAATKDFAPTPDRTLTFDVKGARVTLLGQQQSDSTWFRLRVEPRSGASEPTRNRVAGDPWIPDWQAFAKSVDGWEFKLPAWREAELTRLRSDEPEPKMPAREDMTGKDRLPPSSSPMPR